MFNTISLYSLFSVVAATMLAAPANAQADGVIAPDKLPHRTALCETSKNPVACFLLARHYKVAANVGGNNDRKRRKYMDMACALPVTPSSRMESDKAIVAYSCRLAGVLNMNGVGGPKNLARSVEQFRTGCSMADKTACAFLAESYEQGRGVPQNSEKAKELYGEACNSDLPIGCYKAARMDFIPMLRAASQALGQRGKVAAAPKYIAARNRSKIACENAWTAQAESCWYFGAYQQYAISGPKNETGALQAFRKGCTLKSDNACHSAALALLADTADTRNKSEAKRLLKSSCGRKHKVSCDRLAKLN